MTEAAARLGFMFTDATYQKTLLDAGAITNIGGSYSRTEHLRHVQPRQFRLEWLTKDAKRRRSMRSPSSWLQMGRRTTRRKLSLLRRSWFSRDPGWR